MKYFSFSFSFFLFFAVPIDAGTLGDTITVTAADSDGDGTPDSVDHFLVRVKDGVTFAIIPVPNPVDDPDGDGAIVVSATDGGTVGTISVSKFLTGSPTGDYKIEASAVDANGQVSPYTSINFSYDPPGTPVITVGSVLHPQTYAIRDDTRPLLL